MKTEPKIARLLWTLGLVIFLYSLIKDLPLGPIGTFLMGLGVALNWGED